MTLPKKSNWSMSLLATGTLSFVTIRRFSELSGYSEGAIRTKISRGIWLEDCVWARAPDGRQLISIQGYEKWVTDPE